MSTVSPKQTFDISTATMFGDGADLSGREVDYWGHIWTILEKNCLGDWTVERREHRPKGTVKITSSISKYNLPQSHPHFATLVSAH